MKIFEFCDPVVVCNEYLVKAESVSEALDLFYADPDRYTVPPDGEEETVPIGIWLDEKRDTLPMQLKKAHVPN